MTGEWVKTCLGAVASFASGKGLHKSEYSETGRYPVMGSNGLLGKCEQPLYYDPVITIGRVGACGEIHRTTGPAWISDNALVVRGGPTCDQSFLYYFLKSTDFSSIIGGTTQPLITQTAVKALPMLLPSLPEQRAIASVLGALDDKIELNRRMNATLEGMARALFQSWFVDFDPVRAKLDGRLPSPQPSPIGRGRSEAEGEGRFGMDAETAALFPDGFEESELGMIPKGWSVRIVGECAAYLSRGVGPAYLEKDGICVLNQKCIRDHRVDFSKARRHDSVKKPIHGRELQPFDVLVNSTGTGTLGRVAQIVQLPEPAIVDSHVTVVRSNPETDPFFFGLNLIGREDEIEALAEGSTGQTELSRTRLGLLKMVIPSFKVQSTFGQLVRPLLLRISDNEVQSHTLATLRDTLLPKLLSGEIQTVPQLYEANTGL